MKNAHKFLEMTMESAKPCKIFKQHGQTQCTQHNSRKSRFACTVEVHKSTRTRIGTTQPRDREDLFAEKAFNLLCYCTLVHSLIPILQAMKKIPDATAAVDKKWKKPEKLLAWQVTKVFGRKRGHPQGTKRGKDHSFWYVHGLAQITASKQFGCNRQTDWMRWTRKRLSIRLHLSRKRRRSNTDEISLVRMSRNQETFTTVQMAKRIAQH